MHLKQLSKKDVAKSDSGVLCTERNVVHWSLGLPNVYLCVLVEIQFFTRMWWTEIHLMKLFSLLPVNAQKSDTCCTAAGNDLLLEYYQKWVCKPDLEPISPPSLMQPFLTLYSSVSLPFHSGFPWTCTSNFISVSPRTERVCVICSWRREDLALAITAG